MAKKVGFPRVLACNTLVDIRHLLSQVRWRSAEYHALMRRWRELCRLKIVQLNRYQPIPWGPVDLISLDPSNKVMMGKVWRDLYENCPSGSPEEEIALGLWQGYMAHDPDLAKYRQRVFVNAGNFLTQIELKLI